ncbi:hypothetical protein GCM10007904_06310 [Oharaeibacter diazotrophicus]|nr:hypothetical protein GCM10007904_06310 [Oharaeibacter diazotrophicus]
MQTTWSAMTVRFEELTLHYQPQYFADGSRMAAVEALLRVLKPTPRLMRPGDVLAHFSDPADAERLDYWVFRRACADAVAWPGLTVSINLSADRFRDPVLVDRLVAICDEVGIGHDRVEIEIVESAYIGDFDAALATIERLRAVGFRIALDDFGTGYSSLSYLLRLPVDKLKIDKCFIDDIGSMRAVAIVQSVIALARALGLRVTAEGVETEAQRRFLKAAGCHYLQGWLFSKAVAPEEIGHLLAAERPAVPVRPPA